jgi:nucleotidyltransferase/DNA polymerase involved in DNA repair
MGGVGEGRSAPSKAMDGHLSVCVGIGPTKTLAKLANHVAKKNPRFGGIFDMAACPEPELASLLKGIKVRRSGASGRASRPNSTRWA